jgi:NADPH:quinone reductase-like Zn-dependent oxidoreductase
VTAWVALTGNRRVTAGDAVLIQGSGGVSVFALQFARVLGAQVIATTSTAEKAERLKALGASDVINYTKTPDWDAKVRELTDGRGVDCIVEIGGPGTIAMSLKALAVGGHVSLIGCEPVVVGDGARSPIADRPRHYPRLDQRRQPRRFRGDEPGDRAAPFAARYRSDISVRRG